MRRWFFFSKQSLESYAIYCRFSDGFERSEKTRKDLCTVIKQVKGKVNETVFNTVWWTRVCLLIVLNEMLSLVPGVCFNINVHSENSCCIVVCFKNYLCQEREWSDGTLNIWMCQCAIGDLFSGSLSETVKKLFFFWKPYLKG